MPSYAVILAAAGKSQRFNDQHYKKPFIHLGDRSVWLHAADRFTNRQDVAQTIIVIAEEDQEFFAMKFGANLAIMGIEVTHGGAERCDSIEAGLAKVRPDVEFVAVHDAARPCLADAWIDQVFAAAAEHGAALLATPVVGTLKRSTDGTSVSETVSRQQLWEAQTPQVFRRELLVEAYAQRAGYAATDDAELVERLGHAVTLVPGSRLNLKITTREDLKLAAGALAALPKPKLGRPGNPLDDMWR
ncbi:MAG: 2-C-methyl-D-erythritol 4-phosphate cytidylyltransferase [Planctomycetota bacterium]